jgi:hypothetical protein
MFFGSRMGAPHDGDEDFCSPAFPTDSGISDHEARRTSSPVQLAGGWQHESVPSSDGHWGLAEFGRSEDLGADFAAKISSCRAGGSHHVCPDRGIEPRQVLRCGRSYEDPFPAQWRLVFWTWLLHPKIRFRPCAKGRGMMICMRI